MRGNKILAFPLIPVSESWKTFIAVLFHSSESQNNKNEIGKRNCIEARMYNEARVMMSFLNLLSFGLKKEVEKIFYGEEKEERIIHPCHVCLTCRSAVAIYYYENILNEHYVRAKDTKTCFTTKSSESVFSSWKSYFTLLPIKEVY